MDNLRISLIGPGDIEFNYENNLGMKKHVDSPAEKIHPEIRAGKNIQYTILFYTYFCTRKLSKIKEAYLRKFGINIHYVNNSEDLKEKIKELKNS